MTALHDWLQQPAAWVRAPGSQRGILVSSRIRLARNISGRPFRRKLSNDQRQALVNELLPQVQAQLHWPLATSMDELNQSQRLALVERHVASHDLIGGGAHAGIVIREDGLAAIMINEEDHIRIQVLAPDLAIAQCLDQAIAIDRQLGEILPWAFHQHYGYLCSCPTNLGTGLRASVMLHLPGLAESKELPRMLRGLGKLHMTARGMNGEGSQACGHFYQISNQRTLGKSEQEILDLLLLGVQDIVSYELLAREALITQRRSQIEDRIWRAWGLLAHARQLGNDELIDQLSWLRLGHSLGIFREVTWPTLDHLLLTTGRAHLQLKNQAALDARERDQLRAQLVRQALNQHPD